MVHVRRRAPGRAPIPRRATDVHAVHERERVDRHGVVGRDDVAAEADCRQRVVDVDAIAVPGWLDQRHRVRPGGRRAVGDRLHERTAAADTRACSAEYLVPAEVGVGVLRPVKVDVMQRAARDRADRDVDRKLFDPDVVDVPAVALAVGARVAVVGLVVHHEHQPDGRLPGEGRQVDLNARPRRLRPGIVAHLRPRSAVAGTVGDVDASVVVLVVIAARVIGEHVVLVPEDQHRVRRAG